MSVYPVPFKLLPVILPLPAPPLRPGSTRDSDSDSLMRGSAPVSCDDDHGAFELELVCGERGGPGLSCIMYHVSFQSSLQVTAYFLVIRALGQ